MDGAMKTRYAPQQRPARGDRLERHRIAALIPCNQERQVRQHGGPAHDLQHVAPSSAPILRAICAALADLQQSIDKRRIVTADQELRARARVDPGGSINDTTTGRAIAIASSTLFCTPRAMLSGATAPFAPASQGRVSGTSPMTRVPWLPSRASTSRVGARPTIWNRASGSRSRKAGMMCCAMRLTASIFGA